ncbi:MAG TPA: hypothetical protein EYQ27_09610 [Gemmatimonadetes bacterium]|nr:hypothetical protein [Gemmatimonadota bacterium]
MTKNPFVRCVRLVGAGLASVLLGALPAVAQDLEAMRPIAAFSTVFLEEMTWMEVRDAIREGTTTAIVATGGVEQNGPYVASGKHNFVLQATTEAIALELGIFQETDECEATRNQYHDDYHYPSIIATTDPNRIRSEQRLAAGLFSINGVDLAPLEQTIENGRRLVRYRAEITARAVRAAIARR